MTFDLYTIIGIIGTSIILVSFLLNQFGKWPAESRSYDVSNAIGSAVLIGYAVLLESIPFLILNAVWFAVSFRDILISYKK